jgi:20S proteasome alpha/beta subunit
MMLRAAAILILIRTTAIPQWPAAVFVRAAAGDGLETLIGITGRDFVLLAADATNRQGVTVTSRHLDKIAVVQGAAAENRAVAAVAVAGDAADANQLVGRLQAECNVAAYEAAEDDYDDTSLYDSPRHHHPLYVDCSKDASTNLQSGRQLQGRRGATSALNVECIAQLARHWIWRGLRRQPQYRNCLLVAGMMMMTETAATTQGTSTNNNNHRSSYAARSIQQQVQTAVSTVSDYDHDGLAVTTDEGCKEQEEEHETVGAGGKGLLQQQPALFWIDEYGALQKVPYGVHGVADALLWSVLDRGYRDDMTLQEALELLDDCLAQLRERYLINSAHTAFCIKCIDASGCRLITRQ